MRPGSSHKSTIDRFFFIPDRPSVAARFRLLAALTLLALALSGTATATPPPANATDASPAPASPAEVAFPAAATLPRAQGSSGGAPLRVTREMAAWARRVVPDTGGPIRRLAVLQAALRRRLRRASDHGAQGDGASAARTAIPAAAFRSGETNCLAFAFLFVALGREVGERVGFALEAGPGRVAGEGELRTRHRHVTAAIPSPGGSVVFDRAGWRVGSRFRPLSDAGAIALLHSNRGAAELLAGRPGAALRRLRRALGYDPRSGIAWTNLGLALRRLGRPEAAATAYRRALRIDPDSRAARRNLAFLTESGHRVLTAETSRRMP